MIVLLAMAFAGATVHEVELGGGASFVTRTDLMFSPLPHQGVAPSVALGWSARGERAAHVVRISVSPGAQLSSGPSWTFTRDGEERESFPSPATLADLQYAVGARLDRGRWTFHVGGTSANHFENLANAFAINSIETYFGALELGPYVSVRRPLDDRQTLEIEGWTPLVGWLARNPYPLHSDAHIWNTRDPNVVLTIFRYLGDGSPQTLNHYQAVHLRGAYALRLGDAFTAFARARVDGFHHQVPWPLAEWQLGLDLGLRGTF